MSENGWEREVLEKLMLQTLKEQRARRRWGIFFKLTTIILVIFVIFSIKSLSFSSKETRSRPETYGDGRNPRDDRFLRQFVGSQYHQGAGQGL